jgi:hypothetical protein
MRKSFKHPSINMGERKQIVNSLQEQKREGLIAHWIAIGFTIGGVVAILSLFGG